MSKLECGKNARFRFEIGPWPLYQKFNKGQHVMVWNEITVARKDDEVIMWKPLCPLTQGELSPTNNFVGRDIKTVKRVN